MGKLGRKRYQEGGGVLDEEIKQAETLTAQKRAKEDAEIKQATSPDTSTWSAGSRFLSRSAPQSVRRLFGGK
jgi:hypothetical protein